MVKDPVVVAKDVLKEALSFEAKGMTLYLTLKKAATNKLTKALFDSLAHQEKDHMAYINKFAATRKFTKLKYTPIEKEIETIFRSFKKEIKTTLKKGRIDNAKGYNLALQLEDKGYKMYSKAAAQTRDKEEKQFFQFLMYMEQEHYESLANIYFYFTQNESWLAENESKTWNWMNL